MINKDIKKDIKDENNRLEDENLDKVTGGSMDEKRFKCPFCSATFYDNNQVINHVSVKHRQKIE